MRTVWLGCLLVLGMMTCCGRLSGQDESARIAAIMRDMEARATATAAAAPRLPVESVVQVSAAEPVFQSVIEEQPGGIPGYLLPEIYSAESSGSPVVTSMREIQQLPVGDGMIFSSAFQRRISPPKGNFANVPDDCGCCDEWQTFMPCESCCRDLGLNPWVFQRARPNCPPHWWVHPNRSAECGNCNSGSCGGACGPTNSHGLLKHFQW